MPRAPRIEYEGTVYHVMACGNRMPNPLHPRPIGEAGATGAERSQKG